MANTVIRLGYVSSQGGGGGGFLEFPNLASFPLVGLPSVFYLALDTGKLYRWSGSAYVEVSTSSVVSVNGKVDVVVLDKNDIGLGNVDNTSDLDKPISTATQDALDDLEERIVPIEERSEVLTLYAYENNAQVYADAEPGIKDPSPLIRDGWYFKNTTAGQKINWYFFDGINQGVVTLGQLESIYAVMTFDSISPPILAIYTFPTGVNDVLPGFAHSRVVYSSPMVPAPIVGKQYLVYAGVNPPVRPDLPRIQLTKSTASSIGEQLPTEQILTTSFGSNSGEAVNQVQYMVETLGIFSDSVKQEIDLRIRTASQVDLNELNSFGYDAVVYVSKNGLDTNSGNQHSPFLTITAAMNSITDASPSKRYVILVQSGAYTETALSLKANVFVVGEGQKEAVRITGPVSMNANFTGSADHRSGFSQVSLLSACDFNWATVTSGAGKLYFNEVSFSSTVNMYGHNNAIAQAQFNSCNIFGNLTISGINVGVFTNNVCFGNVTLNQHPNTNMATILVASGGHCNGVITQNASVDNFGRRSASFLRHFNSEQLVLNGPSVYADVDLVSQGKQTPIISNGANLIPLTAIINHDITTKNLSTDNITSGLIKPKATNTHNMGDWGTQWFWNFGYVHASTGTDLFLISYGSAFGADSSGKSIGIYTDGGGLQPDVNSGEIVLQTANTTGTGVRGKITLNGREIDVTSKQIKNLADGTDQQDAVTVNQLQNSFNYTPANSGNWVAPAPTEVKQALDSLAANKISSTEKGAANGVTPLNSYSKIDAIYLPSYVDDVEEYANLASFPLIGETGKIYIALDTNLTYRWSGSVYIEISPAPVLSVNGQTQVVVLNSGDLNNQQAVPAYWDIPDNSTVKAHLDELALRREAQNTLTKEPTGFATRDESVLSFSDSTPDRTFTIAPVGASFMFYVKGVKFVKNSAESIQLPNLAGNHFIYYSASGVLSSTQVAGPELFQDNALISIVYWNTDTNTHTYFAEERHGLQMDGATHSYLHTVFGAQFISGLALENFSVDGNGSLDAHAQFIADEGTIRDEDLVLTSPVQNQIPILFRQGQLWRKKAADNFPLIYSGTAGYTGANGRIPFNQLLSGSWQLTEAGSGNFVLVHFFATNDKENPIVGIQGINQYTNIPAARIAASSEITSLSGLPFAEFVAIGTVIFQTNTYANTPDAVVRSVNGANYVDFRGTQLYTPAGEATTHGLLSGLGNDDHIQYHTDARGDARYYTKAQVDVLVSTITSPGDIQEQSYSFSNSQIIPESIAGFQLSNALVRTFNAVISVQVEADSDLFEFFEVSGIQKNSEWDIAVRSVGDNTGIIFSITSTGQMQYTSSNYSGFISGTMKFKALTTSV